MFSGSELLCFLDLGLGLLCFSQFSASVSEMEK